MQIRTPIIPTHSKAITVDASHQLDYKAICIFSAIGFFLDIDTYWVNKKVLRPGEVHTISKNNSLEKSKPYFNWHYTPRDISPETALEEFTMLFEAIIKEQTEGKKVILPLSGGLDSRTQATALKHIKADVSAYSYEFENGYSETKIARQIAKHCDFKYKPYTIKSGYLWGKLKNLIALNKCYSDFTSPRQMAIIGEFEAMGDVFSLGHWGDVLFDSYNLPQLSHTEEVEFLTKKLVKRGGLKLASELWQTWGLEGNFKNYLKQQISKLLDSIDIKDTNAKLRAFKSKYWAPRWTSVNLSIFSDRKPITLPYYDNRMCEWICTIPETYLKNRQLQMAYIKQRNPNLANITWQDQRPFNLYNYKYNKTPYNLPYRSINKLKRDVKALVGKPYIQRNWELQFLGSNNRADLEAEILNANFETFLPRELIKEYLNKFYNIDALKNAHAINMLLVLAMFHKTQYHGKTN